MTTLDKSEIEVLLESLQGKIEEGRLKANQLRKQESYEASEEVMEGLLPVQALLDRITKVWIEVVKLQQPVITISVENYH